MDLEANGDETNNHSSFGPTDWDNWFMTIAAMGLVMILGYLVYDAIKSIAAEMMQNLLIVSPLILVIVVHWLSTSNWFDIHMPGSEPDAIYRAGGSPWAPKFESLITEEEDSRERIRSLLKIDEQHRKFGANLGTITPMASESTFNLEDLDTFFAVKKEKTSPSAPKPRAMTTRSSKSTKKRKGVDTVDLEEPSDLSISDLLKRASAKYAIEKEQNEKQIEVLEDQKKIFTAKAGHFEKELVKVKKQMKDMEATHKLQFKEHIDGAKKSAAIAVLRAKIQLVNQAKADGVDSLAKNMKEWGKILATLAGDKVEASVDMNKAGEVGETSKAGEVEVIGAEAGMAEQEVTMGDDDNDAKV